MPIYEYRCKKCNDQFEMIRPMGDSAKRVDCPKCGAKSADKLPTTFAAHGGSGSSTPAAGCGSSGFG